MIIILASFALPCGIELYLECGVAYNLFVQCFNKQYSDDSQQQFCTRFEQLKEVAHSCTDCTITSAMDLIISSKPINIDVIDTEKQGTKTALPATEQCQRTYCYVDLNETQFPTLGSVYKSVHHAEAGLITSAKSQGNYGTCWAFATVALLENAILLDQQHISSQFWKSQIQLGLDLSEAYIAVNVQGFNNYASGGDTTTALNYMNRDQDFSTIETESHYPYSQMPQYVATYPTLLNPNVETDKFKPFMVFSGIVDTPVVKIYDNKAVKWGATDISRIKSYLSKGIAIAIAMRTGGAPNFVLHDGTTYISQPCNPYMVDHAVAMVGYGTISNKEVWVIKNSWGTGWGASGYFYTPISEDNFCMERYAFAIIPKYFPLSSDKYQNIGSHIRGGSKELDPDDGGSEQNNGIVGPLIPISIRIQFNGFLFVEPMLLALKDVSGKVLYSGSSNTIKSDARSFQFPIRLEINATGYKPVLRESITAIGATSLFVEMESQTILNVTISILDQSWMAVTGMDISTTGAEKLQSSFLDGAALLTENCAYQAIYQVTVSCGQSIQSIQCICGGQCVFQWTSYKLCQQVKLSVIVLESQSVQYLGKLIHDEIIFPTSIIPLSTFNKQDSKINITKFRIIYCADSCLYTDGSIVQMTIIYEKKISLFSNSDPVPNVRFFCSTRDNSLIQSNADVKFSDVSGKQMLLNASSGFLYISADKFPINLSLQTNGYKQYTNQYLKPSDVDPINIMLEPETSIFSNNVILIVVIAVGGCVIVVITILVCCCCCTKSKSKDPQQKLNENRV